MRLSDIIIALLVFLVAFVGSLITGQGMDWYREVRLPPWTPPGRVIGTVWTILFILAAVSIRRVWNGFPHGTRFHWIITLFVVNGALNVGWSTLFFGLHQIDAAVWEAALLGASVLALIILIWPRDRIAAALLLPYFLWVCFATYLNAVIARLN